MTLKERAMRIVLIVVLGLTVVAGGLWVSSPSLASPVAGEDSATSIPCQGRLAGEDGQPVADGDYDFVFGIYDARIGGEPLWTETQAGVAVRDGYFSVLLGELSSLGIEAASGEHYLAVSVRGPDDEGFTPLNPRHALEGIIATAQQTVCGAAVNGHWGETWTGDLSALTRAGLTLRNTLSTVEGRLAYYYDGFAETYYAGVYGSSNDYGVRGEGDYAGVNGLGFYGVYGKSTSSGSGASGVYGVTSYGPTSGVQGKTTSSADYATGVYGYASATSGLTYGVSGQTDSTSDGAKAVVGFATATTGRTRGVYGQTASGTTNATGVYGVASSTTGDVKGVQGISHSTDAGVAVVGTNYGDRHAGWFGTDNFVAITVKNDSPSTTGWPALELQNDDASGHLITAWNGSDLEFFVHGDGNVTADGAFTGGGADLAEMIAVTGARADYEPGDVLVISADQVRAVALSSQPNDTSVIGVYSTQPGFVGRPGADYDEDKSSSTQGLADERIVRNSAAEEVEIIELASDGDQDTIPVAIAGIVPVKVSAENGPIQPGDLLTTASLVGHAMKAGLVDVGGVGIYRPGTIVGKALEPLAEGTGVIQVLVMLQ